MDVSEAEPTESNVSESQAQTNGDPDPAAAAFSTWSLAAIHAINVRVLMPAEGHECAELVYELNKFLHKLDARVYAKGEGKTGLCYHPTAQYGYEEKVDEAVFEVFRPEDANQDFFRQALNFALLWCCNTGLGLHDQFWLEILNQDFYFAGVPPFHSVDAFGFSLGTFLNAGIFCDHYCWRGRLNVEFQHDQAKLSVNYKVEVPNRDYNLKYSIKVTYASIEKLVVDYSENNARNTALYLQLKHPPAVYVKQELLRDARGAPQVFWRTGIAHDCGREQLSKSSFLRLVMSSRTDIELESITAVINRLKCRSRVRLYYAAIVSTPFAAFCCSVSNNYLTLFDCEYTLLALLSRGYYVEDQLNATFLQFVSFCCSRDSRATLSALEDILAAVDEHKAVSLLYAFYQQFKQHCSDVSKRKSGMRGNGDCDDNDDEYMPKNCVRMKKVIITPTSKILMAPDTMMGNRIVRRFGEQFALRVVFKDDDGNKWRVPRFMPREYDEIIERTLVNGIHIGRRHYEFLAWSNSQLHSNGCYMYCKTDRGETADDIRRWMGDFSMLKSVPKLMARMGQCFTQAQAALTIPWKSQTIQEEADVTGGLEVVGSMNATNSGDSTYVFSDGVGRMSLSLAKEVAGKLDLDPVPSAFQIRYAGYKGVLSVDPRLDQVVGGPKLVFRKSMNKFDSDTCDVLEIVKHSQPSPVTLNRPLIMILDQVTAQESLQSNHRLRSRIRQILEAELFEMADMLLKEEVSIRVLTERTPMSIGFRELRLAGISLTTEPFFRNILLSIHNHNLSQQLSKMKIEVDPALGRTMYGILDETGLLFPNQVFVQYSRDITKPGVDPVILTGKVMVTKNPSVVPGDVRILTAVNVKALNHLVDVIVFPQHGPRPLPDQMAGSDLDGDEYSVYWDAEMMFTRNHPAMHFPKPEGVEGPDHITVKDMIDFFKQFMSHDSVGYVSIAHLIAADRLGIFSSTPMSIALQHSIAVDFSKTGIPPEPLADNERPKVYPDYLMRALKPTYSSSWLLGDLYRTIKVMMEIVQTGQQMQKGPLPVSTDLVVDGWQKYEAGAIQCYKSYAQHLTSLIDRYGVPDEGSLVSGHFVSVKNRISDGEKEDFSFFNTEKIIALQLKQIFDRFRQMFFADFQGDTEEMLKVPPPDVQAKASAWYVVAYTWPKYGPGPTMLSFPWVVWEVLRFTKMMKTALTTLNSLNYAADPVIVALEQAVFQRSAGDDPLQAYMRGLDRVAGQNQMIQTYLRFYDDDLRRLLLVVLRWRDQQATTRGGMAALPKPSSVILVFFYYLLEVADDAVLPYDTVDSALQAAGPSFAAQHLSDKGKILIDFFKYVASDRFRSTTEFNIPGVHKTLCLFETKRRQCLSNFAFRTYHHIALTGSDYHFRPLNASPTHAAVALDEVAEMEPIHIIMDLKRFESTLEVQQLLQQWSGVEEVCIRPIRQRDFVCSVSAYGSMEARHLLERILLCPNLDGALLQKRCPLQF